MVVPLDWGLGHAARCIPIIKILLNAGFKVVAAAEGDQKILLATAFPAMEIFPVPGYRVRYGSTAGATIAKIFFQIPKILMAINRENRWLRDIIRTKNIAAVISDNRYGLFCKSIPTVFISHQLLIKTSLGKLADGFLQRLNYAFIQRFTFCWVPDAAGPEHLAGELSHPQKLPRVAVRYIGWLSRFGATAAAGEGLLVLLSGTEPQRTILEKKVIAQLAGSGIPTTLVRGLPAASDVLPGSPTLQIFNFKDAGELAVLARSASVILCRSGYSSIMDLLPLHKKCILIPVPGQEEQRYLADYLSGRNLVLYASQGNFSLPHLYVKACSANLSLLPAGDVNSLTAACLELFAYVRSRQPTRALTK